MEPLERREVVREVVVERDAVEAEVRRRATAPRARSRGGRTGCGRCSAVRNGRERLLGVGRAAGEVDVGRVVGADGGRDGRVVEEPLADRQRVVRAGRHQHDVDEPLARDQPHLLAVLFERLEPDLARRAPRATGRARRCRSAMSASLASARMNSRQFGSAWIAASLRSSDLSIAAPARLARDRHPRAAADRCRRRPSPSSPGPPVPVRRGRRRRGLGRPRPWRRPGSSSGPGRSSRGGPGPSAARPRLPSARARSRAGPRRPCGRRRSAPRGRRRGCRRCR